MDIQKNVPIGQKTTMRIGGEALYYADILSKEDCKQAVQFAEDNNLPLVILGGGSNTIFADGTINALVARIQADDVQVEGSIVTVQAGKNLAMLINELAGQGLDLSALTGIPGSIGGAIVGNAGQGPMGTWINYFTKNVTAYVQNKWEYYDTSNCCFGYRESMFKHSPSPTIVWEATLEVPQKDPQEIQNDVERLLQKRIETQPHVKTSGSCFKAVDGEPAWKLIDAAGLRGRRIGDMYVSEKHANFLINDGKGTFRDAVELVQTIEEFVDKPLDVEMRFIKEDGSLEF